MMDTIEFDDFDRRGRRNWLRIRSLLLMPISALSNLIVVTILGIASIPLIGGILFVILFPFTILLGGLAYWVTLLCAGSLASAHDSDVAVEDDLVTLSTTPNPVRFPYRRRAYQFSWAQVKAVEGVFGSPFRITLLTLKTGEAFKEGLNTDWSAVREEAERRGLFENSGRHASFEGAVEV